MFTSIENAEFSLPILLYLYIIPSFYPELILAFHCIELLIQLSYDKIG